MAVTDIGVSLIASALRGNVTIEGWWDDITIRSLSKQGKIHWPMEPDGVLILRVGDTRQVFMIEADMGTESVESNRANSWSTKMSNYRTYFSSIRKTDPWLGSYPQPQVLTVTPSARRLSNLMQSTAKQGGRSSYWFSQQEFLEPPYGGFDEVWQRIGLDGYFSVLERFPS
jgi:hypothetical protein